MTQEDIKATRYRFLLWSADIEVGNVVFSFEAMTKRAAIKRALKFIAGYNDKKEVLGR